MRAVGAPFTLGIGAHPLIARLRQHVVPPQPPFRVHPPNPPQGGLSCSLLPFAVQNISDQISQQSTTEMGWCRVVGPRGLCRPLDEKQATNKQPGTSRPVRATRRADTAGQGRAAGRRHYSPRVPRLYPPSPCCRDARPGASVGASSAHANGQRRSRQFRV